MRHSTDTRPLSPMSNTVNSSHLYNETLMTVVSPPIEPRPCMCRSYNETLVAVKSSPTEPVVHHSTAIRPLPLTVNSSESYNQALVAVHPDDHEEEQPVFDSCEPEEQAYLTIRLPQVPLLRVVQRIDDYMCHVASFVKRLNIGEEPLVLSSSLITRRFAHRSERHSLTGMVMVMTLCGKILRHGVPITASGVFEYFRNKYAEPFFRDQEDCDKTIRETSMLLGASRESMGLIIADGK